MSRGRRSDRLAAQRAPRSCSADRLTVAVASFEDIAAVLSRAPGSAKRRGRRRRLGQAPGAAEESIDSLRDLASGAPVVRAVNDLLEKAIDLRASDIHIEPMRNGLNVRMRVDGLLRAVPAPAHALPQALISRIKILAGLNIAERRLPQDGGGAARGRAPQHRHSRRHHADPAWRIRGHPPACRETAAFSISQSSDCAPHDERKIRRFIDLPHGMIVITGPTGSGKTTTLATMLSVLNTPFRKILTIEDPVEYEIAGVNQSQVKPAIGLTFAAALRAFVRQDPDVIMVGEIRDAETASIAIHAALTGHLVLTTLHTETAVAAVPRLLDLGVEGFLLRSTLRGVIGQRLVRVLCDRCKIAKTAVDRPISPPTRATRLADSPSESPSGSREAASGAAASAIAVASACSKRWRWRAKCAISSVRALTRALSMKPADARASRR